ncbi:MAG: hypothetical protein BWY31_01743 [Lentisphaerae bacterium ADurb.Bin242]|nr:MAG: hypothetical protein BWY31_01743 [Lentisphaerae bacterium ADurb.Bin242]
MVYYYDFESERKLGSWREISRKNGNLLLECEFESEEGEFLLLWDEYRKGAAWEPRILKVNGADAESQDDFHIRNHGIRRSMPFHATAGKNRLTCEIQPRKFKLEEFKMYLLPARPEQKSASGRWKRHPPAPEKYPDAEEFPREGYRNGLGHEVMPGRFGFVKGDGLLDCAMSRFGKVDKMFLCGHPRYLKPFAWAYSLLQEEKEKNARDEIRVNAMSVRWKRNSTSFTYSIASPGIITETTSDSLRISKLEYAGNYQYVLTAGETAALDDFSGDMPENWLLFFGSTEFPDIPLLAVLDRKPRKIEFSRLLTGQLSSIVFHGCSRMVTATPFGFEALDPKSPGDKAFLEDAVRRSRLWSRAFLAFPVGCREFFKTDYSAQKVRIIQEFKYRIFSDDWNTTPLKLAPLPPVLTLCGQALPEGHLDFKFPTKYGKLLGFAGSFSAYTLSMMCTERKYPLRNENSRIPELLGEDLDEYFSFEARFPDNIQSYAYPGAILESYAYACSMINFMPEEKRKFVRDELRKRMPMACDPERKYALLLTDHELLSRTKPGKEDVYRYYMSGDIGKLPMFNLYERREPFTKRSYFLCYFNVSMMLNGGIKDGSREEVAAYPEAFVENDWGIGITFYLLYTSALATGDFSAIEKYWHVIRKIFSYFDIYHDWACMGAGYAEKARTWIEGANFGAFTSFIHMARAVGDTGSCEHAVYLASKMLALCEARFLSAAYFAEQYGVDTWYGNRTFQEEYSPCHNFQYVPKDLNKDRVMPCGISMLTTDAIYPELFESFRKTVPEAHRDMMNRYRKALRSGLNSRNNVEFSYLLVNDALDERIPVPEILKNIALAEQTGRFLQDWHDIHRFENALPKNYLKAQIAAWLEIRKQSLWLENWIGLCVEDAVWRTKEKRAVIRIAATDVRQILCCGIRRTPKAFSFTGKRVSIVEQNPEKLVFSLNGPGILTVDF